MFKLFYCCLDYYLSDVICLCRSKVRELLLCEIYFKLDEIQLCTTEVIFPFTLMSTKFAYIRIKLRLVLQVYLLIMILNIYGSDTIIASHT